MKFILASKTNLSAIINIVHDAQTYLAFLGINQWQNGYPNEEAILKDIANCESYLVINKDKIIMATAMFSTRTEPTYAAIEGNWLTKKNAKYGVIHRMAVGKSYRNLGLAKFVFSECETFLKENKIASMRIDTHQENKGMQGLLKKQGYTYCGVIYLADGNKRLAFEKLLC